MRQSLQQTTFSLQFNGVIEIYSDTEPFQYGNFNTKLAQHGLNLKWI